ncbi:MAG: lipopolysaccharide heptosyltransferase II [Planctomycetes bacterium]|nr:lipopolysaccharide heptosyltransferase II [Planctomycetota bacterium]
MVREDSGSSNVVVRAPNALGDLVMATPAFARLAAYYGRENLTLVCMPIGKPLLEGNTWFREILPYDRKGKHRGLLGTARFASELRKRKFDLGFILPNSFSSAWLFFQGRVKERVGYFKDGRSFLLHRGRERDMDDEGRFVPKYTGQYFMELLDVAGVSPGELRPSLPVSDAERGKAEAFIAEKSLGGGPLVICAPGGAFGPSKLWPSERYAKVLNELADAGAKILISHAPNEQVEADAVIKASGRDYPTNAGLDLGTLKAVYEKAALVLTNDTGPRHIGVALGRPVICVMGPNDPRYTALPGVELGEVIREPVDCTPYSWPCQLKECPIDHRCMDAISVERVLNACRRVLGRS